MRKTDAWMRCYRALNHGQAANACRSSEAGSFPVQIREFARLFASLQDERHSADYDPQAVFLKSDVERRIVDARATLTAFERAPRPARKSFATVVVFRRRP